MKPLATIVNSVWFRNLVVTLILVNAAILGMRTYPEMMKDYPELGEMLFHVERAILWFFVFEITLKIIVLRGAFFRRPWNIFDFAIVFFCVLPAYETLSFLLSARVLMLFMLISDTPRLRRTMGVLTHALPGIASIVVILCIIFYVFAIIGRNFYGGSFPEWFGNLHLSLFSLFQVMTLDGWAGMVDEVMEVFPSAWVYFLAFIIVSTFTVLNLFIAVMVDALNHMHRQEEETEIKLLRQLRLDVAEIKEALKK